MAALLAHKWIAAVVGVLLAGLPVLLLTSWLYKQGEPEVLVAAKSSIRVTELIIDETENMFAELDARGVRSCGLSDVRTLQRMAFASASIKELAIVDRNGQTLCTDRGNAFVPRDVIAAAPTSNPEVVLEVVRTVESNERLLRVRRLASKGKASLAALLRVDQFLPRIAPNGDPFSGYARMTLADGTLIGTEGKNPIESNQQSDPIVARAISKRYGPVVTIKAIRHGAIANHDDLRRIGIVFIAIAANVIILCAFRYTVAVK